MATSTNKIGHAKCKKFKILTKTFAVFLKYLQTPLQIEDVNPISMLS